MDVTKLLEADHRQVEALFDRIMRADGPKRTPLIHDLAQALQGHMALEEQTLYPAMGPVTGTESVEEASNEHTLARHALHDMLALAPDEPGFGAALEEVRAGIEHHVEEEEDEVFPALRKQGSLLSDIATPFMVKRLELGLPMEASALAAATTKQELLAEARRAGVEGTSSMNKEELAGAVAALMA